MKENLKKKINFIRTYLGLIILFPTLIGGLWQLIELALIAPSYIRFFSVSQVIPDGLLVLLFIGCIIISFFITIRLFKYTPFYKSKMQTWWDTILFSLLLLALCIAPNIYMYFGVIERGYVEIADIFTFIGTLTFFFSSLIFLLPEKVKSKFLEKQENKDESENIRTSKNDEKPTLKNYFLGIGFLLILFFALFLFSISTEVISKIRNDAINTDLLLNMDCLKTMLSKNENLFFQKILYFNDKYIFIEYKDSINNKFIEVMKADILFELNNCR